MSFSFFWQKFGRVLMKGFCYSTFFTEIWFCNSQKRSEFFHFLFLYNFSILEMAFLVTALLFIYGKIVGKPRSKKMRSALSLEINESLANIELFHLFHQFNKILRLETEYSSDYRMEMTIINYMNFKYIGFNI